MRRSGPRGEVQVELDQWARSVRVVVIAEPAAGLADARGVYRGLRRRLAVVPHTQRPGVLRPIDVAGPWLASLTGPDERFLDIAAILGPVLARRRDWAERDLQTRQALMAANGSGPQAASQLSITERQLRRRAHALADRMGIRFDSLEDQMRLGWALLLYRLAPHDLPPVGDKAWARVEPTVRNAR